MTTLKLAFRNLVGAGLRTWLNVIVLSFSFVVIVWHKGILNGWDRQAQTDMTEWDIGGGQYWHKNYDTYDLFTITDSHGILPNVLNNVVNNGMATPILIRQGTIYPYGRMQTVLLRGIDPEQQVLKIPSHKLNTATNEIPIIIGKRTAKNNKLKEGDIFTMRWRDKYGTFDACNVQVVHIFKTNVPEIDVGKVYLSIDTLRKITGLPNEATIVTLKENQEMNQPIKDWDFKSPGFLLTDIKNVIKQKSIGGSVLYIILLLLAMLAIFDTQILSIFRRQKEIGTFMALGMTRDQVIRLFTVEGAMHSLFAAVVAAIYGIPLLALQAKYGFSIPASADEYGLAMTETIFPLYGIGLVFGTVIIVLITTTIVSYLPSRKIAKMKPTEAIRGKLQ